jgi:hypothetical protein
MRITLNNVAGLAKAFKRIYTKTFKTLFARLQGAMELLFGSGAVLG